MYKKMEKCDRCSHRYPIELVRPIWSRMLECRDGCASVTELFPNRTISRFQQGSICPACWYELEPVLITVGREQKNEC